MRLSFLMGASPFFAAGCLSGAGVTSGNAVLPLVGDGRETPEILDEGGAGVLDLVVVDFGQPHIFAFGGRPTFLVIFVGASLLKNRRSPPFPAYFSPSLVLKWLFGLGIAVAMASGGKPISCKREMQRILGLT